jgi:hypothetical protein
MPLHTSPPQVRQEQADYYQAVQQNAQAHAQRYSHCTARQASQIEVSCFELLLAAAGYCWLLLAALGAAGLLLACCCCCCWWLWLLVVVVADGCLVALVPSHLIH